MGQGQEKTFHIKLFDKSELFEEVDTIKSYIFSIAMNIIAAIVLFGKGSLDINNLGTSIPATLCIVAAILAIVQIKKEKENK